MVVVALSVLALCSAALTIRAQFRGARHQVYAFKPAATVLLLVVALMVGERHGASCDRYTTLVAAGLAASLAGDIWLMLPGDRFVPGLASFLLAHLLYIGAFRVGGRAALALWPLAALAVYCLVLYRQIAGGLGRLRTPVLLYMLVIALMVWTAAARWLALGGRGPLLAAGGAVLFLVSDSALAVRRFRGRFRGEPLVVLGTYWLGQWLIALSAVG